MKWSVALGMMILMFMFCTAACADIHTVTLKGRFLSDSESAVAGYRHDLGATADFQCRDRAGNEWNMMEIASLDGFEVLGASMRIYASEVEGKNRYLVWRALDKEMRSYPMRSSGGKFIHEGWNLFDVTSLFNAWLVEREPVCGFSLSCVGGKKGHQAIMDSEIHYSVTFRTSEQLPLFPYDRVNETEVLDNAFSLLEEENVFLRRYDETADSLTTALYPLGVPYYFGGHNEDKILQIFYPLQESNYFKPYRKYLCGFDCAGYTNWCLRSAGVAEHPDLDSILARGDDSFFLDRNHPETWPYFLLQGDIITVCHGYDHVMIYVGTLRTMGFTEEDAGDAAAFMDYPIVIHCGSNPFYYERYAEYLKKAGNRSVTPTDGGVTVSILMTDLSNAPKEKDSVWGTKYGYFNVGGTPLLVFPLKDCTECAWYGVIQ